MASNGEVLALVTATSASGDLATLDIDKHYSMSMFYEQGLKSTRVCCIAQSKRIFSFHSEAIDTEFVLSQNRELSLFW